MTVSETMVERMLDAYWGKPVDRQWSDDERKVMRACLTAVLSGQVVASEKELTLVRSQLAECHKEIFKLREALMTASPASPGAK
jgi:hypothetical protein